MNWEGFEDPQSGCQIVNPTLSPCGRFMVQPEQYGFEPIQGGWIRRGEAETLVLTRAMFAQGDLQFGEQLELNVRRIFPNSSANYIFPMRAGYDYP